MARIDPGTSSAAVRTLQIDLNTILGGNKLKVTGTFDEETQAALDQVRDKFKLPGQSGAAVDAALQKKIAEAAEPRLVVTVQGKSHYVTKAEYVTLLAAARKKGAAIARPWLNMYDAARIAYEAHERVRDRTYVGTKLIEAATGAKFPEPSDLAKAKAAANKIAEEATSLTLTEASASSLSGPIRTLFAAMDQYVEETELGGPKFVENLTLIKDGSVVGLKVLGAIWSAGKTGPQQVGMSAAIGGYEALLNEIAGAAEPKASLSGSIGNIAKGAVVEGMVTAVMKGNVKGLGNVMDDAVKEVIKRSGAKTLEAYAAKALNSGAQKVIEEGVKLGFGAGDLSKAKTPADLQEAIVKSFLDGLAMGALGQLARNYTKGKVWQHCAKYLHKTAKGLKARDGWEDGVKKIVEAIGVEAFEKEIAKLVPKAGLDTGKVEEAVNRAIAAHPDIQKAMREGGGRGSRGH